MTLSPSLRNALQAELSASTMAGTGHENKPHSDTYARAQMLYDLVREVYDQIKIDRPKGGPGELTSIGRVADAAEGHLTRAMMLMNGQESTADAASQVSLRPIAVAEPLPDPLACAGGTCGHCEQCLARLAQAGG